MSRFNTTSTGIKTVNQAGGEAYMQSPKLELVSLLITSFAEDKYYEKATTRFERIRDLLKKVDPLFAAKAAIFARVHFGMRSISHVIAAELAPYVSGKMWADAFYDAVIFRPDDMTEIFSYVLNNKQKLSSAAKRGFAKAFNKFDGYRLAKYRGENKSVKLVDVVNMVHPVPTEKNQKALSELVKGTLRSRDTWESKLTKAGQEAVSDEDKAAKKKEAWVDLVKTKKIGYFALLRNLRNILTDAPEAISDAVDMLTDKKLIKKSLVLPFRYFTAINELSAVEGSRDIISALGRAAEISLDNVPELPGKTLVALDVSGSMSGRPSEIGKMFGSVIYKKMDADLLTFDTSARFVNLNPKDSVLSLMRSITFSFGGTDFNCIFPKLQKGYDRIIILSDMQAWVRTHWGVNPKESFADYKKRTGADPVVYSFDLQGYGNMQFPERNVYSLSGWSEKIFDIMALLEQDPRALINEVDKIQF